MASTAAATQPGDVVTVGKLCLLGAVVGLLAGAGAALFVAAEHHLSHLLWHTLPEAMGMVSAPWWLVLGLPIVGGALTYAAAKLPGHGGHPPLAPMALDIGPREVSSAVLAALASLSFGAVLGPEGPLLAVGTAAGALALRSPQHPARQVMMIVGAMAAMGAVFGNPVITAFLLLEMAIAAGAAMASAAVLLPSLVGLGAGYVLQVGVADWTGLGQSKLNIPGLEAYPTLRLLDVGVGVGLALVVAILTVVARWGATRVASLAKRAALPVILAAGAVSGLAAVAVSAATGLNPDVVLFAGQSSMGQYLGLASAGTALIVLVGKLVAYTACLGGGFRGGQLFPAIAIGAILAAAAAILVPGTSVSALAAAAIAAATAAGTRFPFTALLLGTLLTAVAGPAVTVTAIVGAVVGMLTRMLAEQRGWV